MSVKIPVKASKRRKFSFSRVPEKDSIFSNWNTSWWKLQDEVIAKMIEQKSYQGKYFNYLNGSAMKKLS